MFAHGSQFGRGLSISGTATRIGVDITAGWQYGGGLYISGTATLTNTNVFENQAGDVCSPFELFVRTFLLVPCWNVACAHGWQDGGGLYISGTATLTNARVYSNQAGSVCLPLLELSSSAPLERYACSCSFGRGAGDLTSWARQR